MDQTQESYNVGEANIKKNNRYLSSSLSKKTNYSSLDKLSNKNNKEITDNIISKKILNNRYLVSVSLESFQSCDDDKDIESKAIDITVEDLIFKWKIYRSSYNNNELNKINNLWKDDNIEEKFDLIKSVLKSEEDHNETSIYYLSLVNKDLLLNKLFRIFNENNKVVFSIPYIVGKKHKYIDIDILLQSSNYSIDEIFNIFDNLCSLKEERINTLKKYDNKIKNILYLSDCIDNDYKKLQEIESIETTFV